MIDEQPPSSISVFRSGTLIGHVFPNTGDPDLPWTAMILGGLQKRFTAEDLAVIWLHEVAEKAEGETR